MNSTEKPLLVTSINPGSNLEYQIKCFERWKAIGFEARTVNVEEEAGKLRAAGIAHDDIKTIDAQDSGLSLFSKPVPRIKPLLESLEQEAAHDFYLISNSDIYPAIRSSSIVKYWSLHAPAFAFTRDETHDLSAHTFESSSPYRGGLDAFFFSRSALAKVNGILANTQAARRMAFGIPGWDYLLGACLLAQDVNGKIVDSAVLLHQSHRPTYGDMEEFACYVQDLRRLTTIKSKKAAQAADEFSIMTNNCCLNNYRIAKAGKLIYYRPPARPASSPDGLAEFERTRDALFEHAPFFEGYYRTRALASLFQRLRNDSSATFDTALSLLLNSKSALFQFNQVLFATVFALVAKYGDGKCEVTTAYRGPNQHVAALENILKRHNETDFLRRVWIARLFGSELLDYRIFNPRLFKYLVLACENDCELKLVEKIKSITRSRPKDAA